MNLYTILVQSHSILRYVALFFLLVAVANSLVGVLRKTSFHGLDLKVPLWTMITFHLQLMIGLVLYVISPKVQFSASMMKSDLLRFFTMEHSSLMILSIALITIGYIRAKSHMDNGNKHILIFYSLALLLILVAVPWPFREALGTKWI
jgi:hypothetical protein